MYYTKVESRIIAKDKKIKVFLKNSSPSIFNYFQLFLIILVLRKGCWYV